MSPVSVLLAEAAEQIGHTVDCASTKTDSEALLEGASPDLAVCNVVLPDGSGYDVAAMALSFGIKSVLITGHQDAGVDLIPAKAVWGAATSKSHHRPSRRLAERERGPHSDPLRCLR